MSKKIAGQIVALTKSIFLKCPDNEEGYESQFLTGKNGFKPFAGGVGISWWCTKPTFKLIERISFMIVKEFDEFTACDPESIQDIITSTLQENCLEAQFFNGDDVFFKRKDTLFLCKPPENVDIWSSLLLQKILKSIREQISRWCTCYVAPRIGGESFSVSLESIHAINKADKKAWDSIVKGKYETNNFDPVTGTFNDGKLIPFGNCNYSYIFVCEENGTSDGSKFDASLKLKKFFSVIFCILSRSCQRPLTKSAAEPYSYCIQFPDREPLPLSISSIGNLLPYYINDRVLSSGDISRIKLWYEAEALLDEDGKNRMENCAHFINHAMNSDDIESYINYFIALDALFGDRGNVERSIEEGINSLRLNEKRKERISWLFDLRNELVHGGSRHIKEWPKYYRYYRHFESDPLVDIEKFAMESLCQFPKI